ncbi:MAG: hypothetical protein WC485_00360 [Opitutaceae bacterium]
MSETINGRYCLFEEAERELERLQRIEIAARSVVDYWRNWPNSIESVSFESLITTLKESLEHGKEKP